MAESRIIHGDNRIVHGLWIGNQLSPIELLTIKSFLANGHEFHLWHYDKIKTELPNGVKLLSAEIIIPREEVFSYKNSNQFGHGKGSFAGFSDLFRYKLLFEKGGWWTDMDVTCLKSLDFSEPYVFRDHRVLPVIGNLMKCPQGSDLMKNCYELARENVDQNNIDWFKPVEILNNEIKRLNLLRYRKRGIINPDEWSLIDVLTKANIKIPSNCYAIHWMNEEWRSCGLSKDSIKKDSTLASLLVKHNVLEPESLINHEDTHDFIFF